MMVITEYGREKVPNPYIRPPDQVNRSVKLIFLNRYRVDRRINREWEVGGHGNIETLVRMINIILLRHRTNDWVVNVIFCGAIWVSIGFLGSNFYSRVLVNGSCCQRVTKRVRMVVNEANEDVG